MSYTYEYPRPAVTVDIILYSPIENNILLVQRRKYPFEGKWALPGGFVDIDEELNDAAKRELKEETDIDIDNPEQFRTYGTPGRDPRHRTISVVYFKKIDKSDNFKAKGGDDAGDAKWFSCDNLPELAFDHNQIINDFLKIVY